MKEFRPNFLMYWLRSAATIWFIVCMAFSAFLILYNERNIYLFIVIFTVVFLHSHIFAKKITITDSQLLKISYLYGPTIFSCQLQDIKKVLFSTLVVGEAPDFALIFSYVRNKEQKVRKIKFDYWTKSQLIDVYNRINSMLPENAD